MERTFAGRVGVEISFFKVKQLAAVLEDKSESIRRKPGAHAAVIALNERDHITVPIGSS